MITTFFKAFLHPSKTVTIDINWMGEAFIELFVIFCFIPIIVYVFFFTKNDVLPIVKKGSL